MFGSVNNTSLIPLLPRLTVLSCISLISSPASNQPEGYSRSLFVCFSTSLVEKWFRCGKHQARRFIFRSERLALYQIISDRALMDRVQNRSETEQGKGIDHSWNRFSFPLLCLFHIVRFPNPLAPDIQIHVSWVTRLVPYGLTRFALGTD